MHWPYSFLMKPFLQLLWACYALFCSLTRITDRRHHWWDVLAGATLGFGVGFILVSSILFHGLFSHLYDEVRGESFRIYRA